MIDLDYRLFITQLKAIAYGLHAFGRTVMTRKIKGGIRRMSERELKTLFEQINYTEDALAAELDNPKQQKH